MFYASFHRWMHWLHNPARTYPARAIGHRPQTFSLSSTAVQAQSGFLWLLLTWSYSLALAPSVEAQTGKALVLHPPSIEVVEAKIEQIEDPTLALSESDRTKALEILHQTLRVIQDTNNTAAENTALQGQLRNAHARTRALEELIQSASSSLLDPPSQTLNSNELQALLLQREAVSTRADETLAKREEMLRNLETNAARLGIDIEDRRRRLSNLRRDLEIPANADETPLLSEVRILALQARKSLRETEIRYFEQLLANQQILKNLAFLERDAAKASVERAQRGVDTVRSTLQDRRENKAKIARKAAEATQANVEALPSTIQKIADDNVLYGKRLEELTRREAAIVQQTKDSERQIQALRTDLESVRSRVQIVGNSAAIARMLRRRLAELPSLRRARGERRQEINELTDHQIDIEELHRSGETPRLRIERIQASDPTINVWVLAKAEMLLKTQFELLDELEQALMRQISGLSALDTAERELATVAREYRTYIREKLLWARSLPTFSFKDFGTLTSSGLISLNFHGEGERYREFSRALQTHYGKLLLGALSIIAIAGIARRVRRQLPELAKPIRRIRTDYFRYTLYALVQSIFIALPLSLLLAWLGWVFIHSASPLGEALSDGLIACAFFVFTLKFISILLIEEGLGQRHFRWPDEVRKPLRTMSIWWLWYGTPLVFIIETLTLLEEPLLSQGLARPVWVGWMGLMLFSLWRLLHPTGTLHTGLARITTLVPLSSTRFLWVPVILVMPLILGTLSLFGYHHTALEFGSYIGTTLWIIIGIVIARSLLLRSLYIVERRLRFDNALKRREEARLQRAGTTENDSIDIPDEFEINYQDLGEQARRLLNIATLILGLAGLWLVWGDFVPALRVLDNVTLPISTTEIIDGIEKERLVTLTDIFFAIGALLLTLFAAKNFTGLLEIVLLRRLPLDNGGRYAITTLSKYAIVALGLIITLNAIGLDWSNIQWLVAALSVGLGFGLQEIVANFISGIILLLERPIRPGDVITIGDMVGTVTRIRIRATTVLNFDRQELLVPNKELITGRLLNWTLSDQTNRIAIPVGIAYGSDTAQALELLRIIASEHPQVLAEPAPIATFDAFGDNTLNLTLRCYLDSLEFRLSTITELYSRINQRFTEAGIEIAFPQRDVHLSTLSPLEIKLKR